MSRLVSLALLVPLLALAGCRGPKAITVQGKVLLNGAPLTSSKTGVVQVTLVPVVAEGQHFTTRVGRAGPDGNFEVLGVPPGKYKVAIEHLDPTPTRDKLKGAFSKENTRYVRDLDGKAPVEIDLAKPGP